MLWELICILMITFNTHIQWVWKVWYVHSSLSISYCCIFIVYTTRVHSIVAQQRPTNMCLCNGSLVHSVQFSAVIYNLHSAIVTAIHINSTSFQHIHSMIHCNMGWWLWCREQIESYSNLKLWIMVILAHDIANWPLCCIQYINLDSFKLQ